MKFYNFLFDNINEAIIAISYIILNNAMIVFKKFLIWTFRKIIMSKKQYIIDDNYEVINIIIFFIIYYFVNENTTIIIIIN